MGKLDTDRDYTREELEKERQYGFYWYSGLWTILRPVAIMVCALLLSVGIAMSVYNRVRSEYFAARDPDNAAPVEFTVASGSSLSSVAKDLEAAGLIKSSTVFKYYADFLGYGQKIQSGDYTLNRTMDLTQIANQLASGDGKPLVRDITIIPGWTVQEIAGYLVSQKVLPSAEEFLALCKGGQDFSAYYYISDVLSQGTVNRYYALEGYLMPDTYEIYTSATAQDIIKKLVSQVEAVYPQEFHDRADELGLTMDQVLTLASIIEKEARTADFARVSAVFHNRLKNKMSFDSDATVKYASGSRKMSLSGTDVRYASLYNTYLYKGFPPGPICSPSRAAIEAALYPDESFLAGNYLYFCSKDPASGELVFARTLEEHEINVSIYRPLWQAYDREHQLE